MYTDAEIRQKQQLARAAGLSGAELLDDVAAIKKDCNGIGAAWMPDATREWISTANPSLVVVADIHDRRYSEGGTEADRQAADAEFRANGMKMAKYVYRWYDPRRYWVIWQVRKFAALLASFGALAFNYREEESGNNDRICPEAAGADRPCLRRPALDHQTKSPDRKRSEQNR